VQVIRDKPSKQYFGGRQHETKPIKNARNRGKLTKKTSEPHERAINSKKRSQCHLFFRRTWERL